MANNKCIFCDIYDGKESANIMYKNDEVVIFTDIRPAAKHHYLVVPKDHLISAKHLTKEHVPLITNLIKYGNCILEEKNADIEDSRLGFHWPPFNTIPHLHLHVISPASQMSVINKLIFKDDSLWFVTVSPLNQLNKLVIRRNQIRTLAG